MNELAGDEAVLWTVVAAVVMVVGLAGVAIPVLPGLALIWGTAIVYGILVGYSTLGWSVIAAMTAILVASMVKGVLLPRRTSAASGASGWAQFGGLVGAIVGFFVIPVLGVIIGALVGVFGVELLLKKDWGRAWTATIGLAKGLGLSALIDLGLGLVMIAVWSVWAWTVVF